MTGPTLGCQIAPSYHHEAWPYNSDSSSDDESGEGSTAREEVAEGQPDIEKAETQRDVGEIVQASRPNTLQKGRTKSSRKEPAQDPVGFWHWSMVCIHLHEMIHIAHD
jgi:hypothetical protein